MSNELELVIQDDTGYDVPAGNNAVWVEVLHGASAGNQFKLEYGNSSVRKVLDSLSEGDVVTAEVEQTLSGYKAIDVEVL